MSHKEALLDGARRCLEEKGYARTTARDLVAASGTNLGSIGYHFGSKERLLNAAISEAFEEWVARLGELATAAPGASPLERVAGTWRRMLDEFPRIRWLLVSLIEAVAQAERSPELGVQFADHYRRCRDDIANTIRASLGEDAEGAGQLPELLASFLIAVCDGFAIQYLIGSDDTPSGEELVTGLGTIAAYTARASAREQS
jgi:AcrR family transcriptional regulator